MKRALLSGAATEGRAGTMPQHGTDAAPPTGRVKRAIKARRKKTTPRRAKKKAAVISYESLPASVSAHVLVGRLAAMEQSIERAVEGSRSVEVSEALLDDFANVAEATFVLCTDAGLPRARVENQFLDACRLYQEGNTENDDNTGNDELDPFEGRTDKGHGKSTKVG